MRAPPRREPTFDLGLVGTEMAYFAVGDLGLDGGITVTASHNPKEYTGMKIVRRGALPVGGDSGLLDIRARAVAASATRRDSPGTIRGRTSGRTSSSSVLSFIDVDAIKPLRVVIDAANGMAGVMLPPVLERFLTLDPGGRPCRLHNRPATGPAKVPAKRASARVPNEARKAKSQIQSRTAVSSSPFRGARMTQPLSPGPDPSRPRAWSLLLMPVCDPRPSAHPAAQATI